jgi:hypothetical protein
VFGPREALRSDDTEDRPSPGGGLAWLAVALLVACQATRWGWWTDIGGHTMDVGYFSQSVAGLAGTACAAGLALAIRARSGAGSGFRTVQLLPLILGLTCLLIVAGGFQQAYTEMASHRAAGRATDLDAGAWLAVAGGVCATVAGLVATRARLRNPAHRDEPSLWSRWRNGPPETPVPVERLRDEGRTR